MTGLGICAWLPVTWIGNPAAPMNSTIHLGFFAALIIVLGTNIVFSSFLLHMMATDQRTDDQNV